MAILIDQHIHGADAVTVDFFNRPAATTSALATLALRTGAPLVPAFALPLAGGRYRMVYEHPVELPPADSADPVRELDAALHRRARDVRAPASPSLALDAPPLARSGPGDSTPPAGMFPAAAPDDCEARSSAPTRRRVERVVVRPPNWLGDAVLALPAMAAVRAALSRRRT